jgi:hypothetical protein
MTRGYTPTDTNSFLSMLEKLWLFRNSRVLGPQIHKQPDGRDQLAVTMGVTRASVDQALPHFVRHKKSQ